MHASLLCYLLAIFEMVEMNIKQLQLRGVFVIVFGTKLMQLGREVCDARRMAKCLVNFWYQNEMVSMGI